MESEILADFHKNTVVWKMDPDVAAFYAEDVLAGYHERHPGDSGVSADLNELRDAIEALEEPA